MKKLTNPNFIYIATFITPFLVYTLDWSTIYPQLTPQLFLFYLLTFSIAFFAGVLIDRLPSFTYKKVPVFRYNLLVISGLYCAYTIDCLYTGYLPLLAFSRGEISYSGSINYGIPTFHVLLVTFSLFFALNLFHQFLSNRKFSLFFLYLLMFVPFILLLQRSAIMYVIIASVFIFFISQTSLSIRRIAGLAIF